MKKKIIKADPASLVDTPKIHEKAIVRLDVNETADFLDAVETGEKLTDRQKAFHEKTKKRDLAMMTLLLGTGMRVSECVGINIKDLDFKNNAVKVTRKGGNEVFLYYGDEVREALEDYLEQFEQLKKMGSISDLLAMIPGANKLKLNANSIDEKQLAKNKSIILSMTKKERLDPDILKGSHKKRIAAGSGTSIQDVNILLKQFNQSKEMMKQFNGKKKGGFRLPF